MTTVHIVARMSFITDTVPSDIPLLYTREGEDHVGAFPLTNYHKFDNFDLIFCLSRRLALDAGYLLA